MWGVFRLFEWLPFVELVLFCLQWKWLFRMFINCEYISWLLETVDYKMVFRCTVKFWSVPPTVSACHCFDIPCTYSVDVKENDLTPKYKSLYRAVCVCVCPSVRPVSKMSCVFELHLPLATGMLRYRFWRKQRSLAESFWMMLLRMRSVEWNYYVIMSGWFL